jgi:hypothetical protein
LELKDYSSSGRINDITIVTNDEPNNALRKTSKLAKPASLVGENKYSIPAEKSLVTVP